MTDLTNVYRSECGKRDILAKRSIFDSLMGIVIFYYNNRQLHHLRVHRPLVKIALLFDYKAL